MQKRSYVIGFPRIGEKRELKKALESYWSGNISFDELKKMAQDLKKRHWRYQKDAGIDLISSNDFSYYDNILDLIFAFNAIPKRFEGLEGEKLYFAMARGDKDRVAMEMTKWFNTNYHYIVPELSLNDEYKLDASKIIDEYLEAKEIGVDTKINIIGPLTFLSLSKRVDGGDPLELYHKIMPLYIELLEKISKLDDKVIVQFDEPIFVKDNDTKLLSLIKPSYDKLATVAKNIDIAVISYFEHSNEATKILLNTPIWAIGLDFVYGEENINSLDLIKESKKTLIAGIVDGRNIWKNDIDKSLELLNQINKKIDKEHIIISSSSSLLHVPYSLEYEDKMDSDIKSWLSFAKEKLDELNLISKIFFDGFDSLSSDEQKAYEINKSANQTRKNSTLIHDEDVAKRVSNITKWERDGEFEERIKIQHKELGYKPLTTTTIGSFPQTKELRELRRDFKNSTINRDEYEKGIKEYIDYAIKIQEECGLDVLVHGEPERNDMVEYFGQMMKGFGFSQNGWVQSYGSRCVKPPFIYGDISRESAMTVDWIVYAQNQTKKIVKGMLTGPVTILNWSFVRDDIKRSEVSKQIALAINDEVDDLQNAGIKIIQVDEAAFKEGYPLRVSKIKEYESWAVRDFKLSVSSAKKQTQIHTHMCYSEFNDIIRTIEAMDADVISIETARSGNSLLKIFAKVGYKQEIGPGVYDIHSPRVPSVEEIVEQINALLEVLPKEQLWINPDCGLKTRKWDEVIPSLKNMTQAVNIVRNR